MSKNDGKAQSFTTYAMIGGRIHAEEILMEVDSVGNPPQSYVDILTGATYYPRTIGYAINSSVTGIPEEAYEALFYILETMDQNAAVQAVSDCLMRQYMKARGTKVKIETNVVAGPPPSQRPSGLILP